MKSSPVRLWVIVGLILTAFAVTGAAVFRGHPEGAFMPHAHCYLFNPRLIFLHGGSDMVIGWSYVAISATLVFLVIRSRRELPFHWMMLAFAAFIVACGATHFMEVWTLEDPHPHYWLAGWVKVVTAAASLATALLLPPLVPKIHAVLESANRASERKTKLEKAYAELSDLYTKASEEGNRQGASGASGAGASERPRRSASESTHDLAGMAKEVTEHARGLERRKEAAEAANRAKDNFLAVLSHELRTPLTPALAAAVALEQAAELDPAEVRETVALIRRNIELEARLVDDLLDITRITKGRLEVHLANIDLHETVEHAAAMGRATEAAKRSTLLLELNAEDHHVNGDGARLAQVFWNLILNAIKFTPAGGSVTVRSTNPSPGKVRVEVTDTGMGIEPAMIARIFEPFQQGDEETGRRYGGVGLGLAIANALVAAHRGKITAGSAGRGQGSVFSVELETTPAVSEERALEQPARGLSKERMRILLVEDHDDTRRVLERLMNRWGHAVDAVSSVGEALRHAELSTPELLVSDIGLPDGSGIELLTALRKQAFFPAIAMSGYGMEADVAEAKRAGFDLHLVKPLAPERLAEAIAQLSSGAVASWAR